MQNKFISSLLLFLSWASMLDAQVSYDARTVNPPYTGVFRPGVNTGYFPLWSNEQLGDLIAGNPANGVKGVGGKVTRPVLAEKVLEIYGYDIVVDDFEYWKSLGMDEFTATLTGPVDWHRDLTEYCPGTPSALFKNLYLPVWDGGANGTPYNDDNYFAAYVYKTVSTYNQYVRFWEIWNEPAFDLTGNKGWRGPGDPQGNWWDNDPEPCDYILNAPIEHYIRTLRIAYEVIETIAPEDFVTVAGFGYQSFLDAVLRNTDNPNGGSPTAEYPNNGGAYIEVHGLHSYPHFDGTTTNNAANFFQRHSDRAAQGLVYRRDFFQEIYDNYDYDGVTYPKKHTIATEMNVPREFNSGSSYFASTLGQRNYIMKCFVTAMTNNVAQFHVFGLSDKPGSGFGFNVMGLYKDLYNTGPFNQVRNVEATAMKTTSDLLWLTTYDAARSAQLNAPSGIAAHAFLRQDGKYVYMLWAKTTTDLSEFAQGTFSFPSSLGYTSLNRYEWDYSDSGIITNNAVTNIALNATPIFLVEQTAGGSTIAINCPANLTLVATGTNGANASWITPTGSTSCPGTVNINQTGGSVSGSLFPIGNTLITYTATNNCGQQTSCSFTVTVTAGYSGLYCDAKSNMPWNEWIARVKLANIDNPSGKCDTECGYGDFNNLTANLSAGQIYNIMLTPGLSWPGQPADFYWRVWMDFNQDGDFTDAGEMVLQQYGSNQIVNASISIPSSAPNGTTGMRIAAKKGAYATPCETFEKGEVEDYTINVGGGGDPGCTVGSPCNDNNACTINDVYNASCNCVGTLQDSDGDGVCNADDQCPGFDDNIDTNNNGTPDGCESSGGNYCTSKSSMPWNEWIAGVALANINNPSGKCGSTCGYSDFTNLSANLSTGQSHNITLTPGLSWPGRQANFYWRVWIDFNKDGDFSDAGEMVLETYGSNQVVNSSIAVPSNAPVGVTRIRITAKKGAYATPCENFEMGEVEDYSANISSGGGGGGNPADYCDAASTKPWEEWIAGVQFAGVNNPSGKCGTICGYSGFTNLTATTMAGNSYPITLTPGLSWSGHTANFYWSVWIDFNSDGDFNDLGETVLQTYGSNQIVNGNIIIPAAANSTTTRMRIAAKKGAYATPCETFEKGEVEDYNISITGSAPTPFQSNLEDEKTLRQLKVFPNPLGKDYLFVDMTGYEGTSVQLQLSNALGQIVATWDIAEVDHNLMLWEIGEQPSGAYQVILSSKESRRRYAQLMIISEK